MAESAQSAPSREQNGSQTAPLADAVQKAPVTRPHQPQPLAGVVEHGHVSMTFRLPADIPAALLRASLERKLRRQKPFTQQEIVAEAVADWLRRNGCLPWGEKCSEEPRSPC